MSARGDPMMRRRVTGVLRRLVSIFTLACAVLWWVSLLLRSEFWVCDLVMSAGVPVLVMIGVWALLSISRRGWRLSVVSVVLVAGSFVVSARGRYVLPHTGRGDADGVSVLMTNVGLDNERAADVISTIERFDADIVVIAEPVWQIFEGLVNKHGAIGARGIRGYPHMAHRVRIGVRTPPMLVLSKWELIPIEGVEPDAGLAFRVARPAGSFVLVGAHPDSPRTPRRWGVGNADIERLCGQLSVGGVGEHGSGVLFAADLNGGAMSTRGADLTGSLGLRRAKPILTLGGTYPSFGPMFGVAIDGVWHGRGWEVLSWRTVRVPGSDHLGVHAVFSAATDEALDP